MHMEIQWTQNSQAILKMKSKFKGLTFPDVKTYYKGTLIKAVLHCHKDINNSLVAQRVKSTCNAGDPGSIPGTEDPLEEGMITHSSILA